MYNEYGIITQPAACLTVIQPSFLGLLVGYLSRHSQAAAVLVCITSSPILRGALDSKPASLWVLLVLLWLRMLLDGSSPPSLEFQGSRGEPPATCWNCNEGGGRDGQPFLCYVLKKQLHFSPFCFSHEYSMYSARAHTLPPQSRRQKLPRWFTSCNLMFGAKCTQVKGEQTSSTSSWIPNQMFSSDSFHDVSASTPTRKWARRVLNEKQEERCSLFFLFLLNNSAACALT